MCNVAWRKEMSLLGVAWVVRNHRGVVMFHSRRAFSDVVGLEEARETTLLWAIESMASMHTSKIIFVGYFRNLYAAVLKPHQWPALRHQGEEIKRLLAGIDEYQFKNVVAEENRGASIIAQSVTRQGRVRSYVAAGHPSWLFELFVNESRFL